MWKVVLLAALIAFVAWQGDFGSLAQHFNRQMLFGVILVQPLMLAALWLSARKFAALAQAPPLPTWVAFKSLVLSQGVNVVLPGRVAELLKATYLRDHAAMPLSAGIATVVLERLVDTLVVAALAVTAMGTLLAPANKAWLVLGPIAFLLLLLVARMKEASSAVLDWIPSQRLREFAQQSFLHAVARVDDRAVFKALLYALLAWVVVVAAATLLLVWLGSIRIGPAGALAVVMFAVIGGAIPALPGGFGTYEAAAVFMLSRFGYGFEEALSLALALHGSQILISVVGAPCIISQERIGIASSLKAAAGLLEKKPRP